MRNTVKIWDNVDARKSELVALADRVWATPETCYMETRSSAEHRDELERQGFSVRMGVAGIPTALVAEAGAEGPVIAFLGEYDALPGLSQEAGLSAHRPIEDGGNGHGCGHNLLGAGAMLAAIAVRDWLAEQGLPGRVRYYGCPAEEGGYAKAFMVRAGLFDDVDIAITWHPGTAMEVWASDSLACTRIDFSFFGRSSHASAEPHLGRSALDAVELMNVGVNYMREHMPGNARVHYAVLDSGGIAPNVVQGFAKVRYAVRAGTLDEMSDLVARVENIAKGAALMTETAVTSRVLAATANFINCPPLQAVMARQIDALGAPAFDEDDIAFARRVQETLPGANLDGAVRRFGEIASGKALADFVVSGRENGRHATMASTDVADVSWVVPTVQLSGANFALGTPFHSWQLVTQGKSAAAHKGMVHAAKAMAATAVELISNPELVEEARAALDARAGRARYRSPLPDDASPPLNDMAW